MVAPIIQSMPEAPNRGDGGPQFDIDATAFAAAFALLVSEINTSASFIDTKAGEALAAALGGDMPSMAGKALQFLRVKADETGAEFEAPADVAEVRAFASKFTDMSNLKTAAGKQTVVDAANITIDFAKGWNCVLNIAGNRVLNNPVNAFPGLMGFMHVFQDATGSRTLSFDGQWKFPGNAAPQLSTAPNAQDVLFFCFLSGSNCAVTSLLDLQ